MKPIAIEKLAQIMAALRDPHSGCPWDIEQSFATIAPYTIEEAYEVADAIERGELEELRGELGDLLFQVVFHARMAEEAGVFDLADVVAAINEKMERRHPHVFAGVAVADAEEQSRNWEALKAGERKARGEHGALDGVARGLPALLRAEKLQKRAAKVGFDWADAAGVFAKVGEELAELGQASAEGPREAIFDEVGDLLFSCVNLARHLGCDPEAALRHANGKFERRFARMEAAVAAEGESVEALDGSTLEGYWQRVKKEEG